MVARQALVQPRDDAGQEMFPLQLLARELWSRRGPVGFVPGEPRVPSCACQWALGRGL